jgi:hypothetical protein
MRQRNTSVYNIWVKGSEAAQDIRSGVGALSSSLRIVVFECRRMRRRGQHDTSGKGSMDYAHPLSRTP